MATTAYDVAELDFEWQQQDCTLTAQQTDAGYTITLSPTATASYAYGFARQRLDWDGQEGLAITLTNHSDTPVSVALHLSLDDWSNLSYPDGTAVLIQNDHTYSLQLVANGMVNLPPYFSGRIVLPFDLWADVETELANLQGFAITVSAPQDVTFTVTDVSFWEEGLSTMFSQMSALTLTLSQEELLIPVTGQTLGVATVINGENHQIYYTIADNPTGITIDQEGRILIDTTCTATEVTVLATVDQQLELRQALSLTPVLDTLPHDQTVEEFVVLDPSHYSNIGLSALMEALRTYVHPTQWIVIGVWLFVTIHYLLWRHGPKKR